MGARTTLIVETACLGSDSFGLVTGRFKTSSLSWKPLEEGEACLIGQRDPASNPGAVGSRPSRFKACREAGGAAARTSTPGVVSWVDQTPATPVVV